MNWTYAIATVGIQLVLGLYIVYYKPEANWGSSAQALTIISALNATQALTDTPDHVKTYRPKLLVLTGNPPHRPSLVDFANIITKKISILITGHVITEEGTVNMFNLRDGMQKWLKDHQIKGYYACTQTPDFVGGARSCMTLVGLGKLSPNMVLIGFKNNWRQDLVGIHQYLDIMYAAFDLKLSFAILRCKDGLDFSKQIASEQQIVREVPLEKLGDEHSDEENEEKPKGLVPPPPPKKTRKISTAVYRGADGNRLRQSSKLSVRYHLRNWEMNTVMKRMRKSQRAWSPHHHPKRQERSQQQFTEGPTGTDWTTTWWQTSNSSRPNRGMASLMSGGCMMTEASPSWCPTSSRQGSSSSTASSGCSPSQTTTTSSTWRPGTWPACSLGLGLSMLT